MKHLFNSPDCRMARYRKSPSTYISYSILFVTIVILAVTAPANVSYAQTVTHPASEVSTTIKHYKYRYNISPVKFEDIGYILIRASNGDIKSAFNACDVCYLENKGYSQSGTKLRCNNCGKTFEIDNLGSQGSGGCWPGHLPHSNDGSNVVIDVPELIKGAYLFPVQTISDVSEIDTGMFTVELLNNAQLKITTGDQEIKAFRVFSVSGALVKSAEGTAGELIIDVSDLFSGAYIIAAESDGQALTKTFYILR